MKINHRFRLCAMIICLFVVSNVFSTLTEKDTDIISELIHQSFKKEFKPMLDELTTTVAQLSTTVDRLSTTVDRLSTTVDRIESDVKEIKAAFGNIHDFGRSKVRIIKQVVHP